MAKKNRDAIAPLAFREKEFYRTLEVFRERCEKGAIKKEWACSGARPFYADKIIWVAFTWEDRNWEVASHGGVSSNRIPKKIRTPETVRFLLNRIWDSCWREAVTK